MDATELQRNLLALFIEESIEGIERFEAGLLRLEQDGSRELVDDLFRVMHSMKGGAGMVGVEEVSGLAHLMENLLDRARRGAEVTRPQVDALLRGGDALRRAIEARRAGAPPACDACATAAAELEALTGEPTARASRPPPIRRWRLTLRPMPHALAEHLDPLPLVDQLAELGTVAVTAELSALPRLEDLDPLVSHLAWTAELESAVTRENLSALFSWIDDICTTTIEELDDGAIAAPPPPLPAEEASSPAEPGPAEPDEPVTRARPGAEPARATADGAREPAAGASSIRVAIDKIDQLINMVGELVITQSMLGQLDSEGPLDIDRVARLREGLGQLARNTRALQDSVMRLRSVPIGSVFNRFPRLVRELGDRLGKEIVLELGGQSTELDKAVVEKLSDPLVHLVRNSVDHGIEPIADRLAAGKPAAGTIRLHAEHRGGDVVVEISDDGRGLDAARILAKARAKGLIGADVDLAERDAHQLVFLPGFSTAEQVSDLSGRGVGMDVVRRHVKELGGDIALDSRLGHGTRITLRLPLTLAIIDGQLIRLGRHQVVIPLLSITESVELERGRVARLASSLEVYRLRDQLIPMLDLAELLALPTRGGDRKIMVVVSVEGTQVGLMVDELLAQQQVVVKSLETNFQRVPGLAGATILGDGQVAFILDVVALIQTARVPLAALAA